MTYSWECKCGYKLEEMTSYDKRTEKCPKCGFKWEHKFTKSKPIWKTTLGR